ncbi:MAG: GH116 family glycosyl hydrolase [Candidatus Woesearchaeota archaeon]
MNRKIIKALEVATHSLKKCYTPYGILAGKRHFDDYWARDGFFACLGASSLEHYKVVRDHLQLFISKQKEDGQIPLRIGCNNIIPKILGIHLKSSPEEKINKVRYEIDRAYPWISGSKKPADQNSLFLVAFNEYCKKSGDWNFARKNYEAVKKAFEWNLTLDVDEDGLIEEGTYCSWLDTVKKSGKVLYTEACHYWGCLSFAEIAKRQNRWKDYKKSQSIAEKVKKKINSLMWNGAYYTDWISEDGQRHEFFSTEGNLMAIMLGIADNKRASLIISKLEEFGLENGVPYRTNYPHYGWRNIDPANYLLLIPDYQDGMSWLWIGCLGIIAKTVAGKKKNAMLLAEKISDIINRDSDVCEVYEERRGIPVDRILYKSERPFAWAAGMFIYAVKNFLK